MGHLSLDAKEAIIKQALNRKDTGIKEIAHENNIGYSTLQRWLKNHRDNPSANNTKLKNNALSRVEKLDMIIATAGLDETDLGIYCRKQGIYNHQLQEWKQELMSNPTQQDLKLRNELKALKAENKKLKKDLYRKDKALAETSALLVLKKKADLIWGVNEED